VNELARLVRERLEEVTLGTGVADGDGEIGDLQCKKGGGGDESQFRPLRSTGSSLETYLFIQQQNLLSSLLHERVEDRVALGSLHGRVVNLDLDVEHFGMDVSLNVESERVGDGNGVRNGQEAVDHLRHLIEHEVGHRCKELRGREERARKKQETSKVSISIRTS
jgi:hypothetical protein